MYDLSYLRNKNDNINTIKLNKKKKTGSSELLNFIWGFSVSAAFVP